MTKSKSTKIAFIRFGAYIVMTRSIVRLGAKLQRDFTSSILCSRVNSVSFRLLRRSWRRWSSWSRVTPAFLPRFTSPMLSVCLGLMMSVEDMPPLGVPATSTKSARLNNNVVWLGSDVVRAMDLQSTGRGFDSRPPRCPVATLGKSFTCAQRL